MSSVYLSNYNHNLDTVECVLQLIKLSLKKKSSSIAVRLDPKRCKIQVVDNGIGFTKNELVEIFDFQKKKCLQHIFHKIRSLSSNVIITTRLKNSMETLVQVVDTNIVYKKFQGYYRPSKGTTVSIYNFRPAEWNRIEMIIDSVSYAMSAISLTELRVAFSLRNDNGKKMILNIHKPHSPWEVLKFVNDFKKREISCLSDQLVKKADLICREENKIEISERSEYSSVDINSDFFSHLLISQTTLHSPLSEWSNWTYNPRFTINGNNFYNYNHPVIITTDKTVTFNENFLNLSPLSVWSDWNYKPSLVPIIKKNQKKKSCYKNFLSALYDLVPTKDQKILGNKNILQSSQCLILDSFNDFNFNDTTANIENDFQNEFRIKSNFKKSVLNECKITAKVLNSFQILKQINNEFIVAIAREKKKKLLVIVDQHAAHERIRYEWLLETYRHKRSFNYVSVKLNKPLIITDIHEKLLEVIKLNSEKFNRVGINIKKFINSTTCMVDTVPQCFTKKIKNYNEEFNKYRLFKNVKQLIIEIADGLAISHSVLPPLLPKTINNVIASEACHGAIKFGDPLNLKECTKLMQALKDTKAPTRCAHGRPSIIPLLNLSGLEKRKPLLKKLNFGALKNRNKLIKKIDLNAISNQKFY